MLAGIPDITKLSKSPPHYRECIYTDKPEHTLTHLRTQITNCTDTISNLGATPIFCTITPMHITHYNNFLLEDNRTRSLHHREEYEDMQTQIIHIITEINKFIKIHNTNRGLTTPMLHFAIIKRHGKGKKAYYRTNWEGLKDGVHVTTKTRTQWAETFKAVINKNRADTKRTHTDIQSSSDDEAPKTPKRAWKQERGGH